MARSGDDTRDLKELQRSAGWDRYAETCGETLALAHSRGDRRSVRFEAAIVEALSDCGDELIAAAETYASQTVEDWQTLNRLLQ